MNPYVEILGWGYSIILRELNVYRQWGVEAQKDLMPWSR